MIWFLCLGLFIPLMSSIVLMLSTGKISRKATGFLASIAILISFICFSYLLFVYINQPLVPETVVLYPWIPIEELQINVSLHIDPLSLVMSLIITGIGFLIHVYSIGYMEHDEDYIRFFAFMNFFVFSMLLLVLAENLLVLYVGWEGVGLASYLLIGFWYQRPSAALAAKKAFVINRIGDFGLLVGILMIFYYFGTGNIQVILSTFNETLIGPSILTFITLLFFLGATGKSAQFPLYTWLPDAMEGPTPVSALIHAATMVTAGVYLVVRMHTLFMMAPYTLEIIGMIGGATAIFASLSALAQKDLKKVLAYSTISQLGLMFLACGVGAFYAAIFHLTTHAFIKALLFLAAGNVVHRMQGETRLDKMGGLKERLPKTRWIFLIGVLALSGLPPFAAFFSKDLILEQEFLSGYPTLFIAGVITSILTAFYLMRAYSLVFLGTLKVENKTVQEASQVMLVPLYILAFLSIIGGVLGFACKEPALLEVFLGKVGITLAKIDHSSCFIFSLETWISFIGSLIGLGSAYYIYHRYKGSIPPNCELLYRAFYINEIYDAVFVQPLSWLANGIKKLEIKLFHRSIDFLIQGTNAISLAMQKMQSGQIRSYLAWMVIGSVLSIVYLIL